MNAMTQTVKGVALGALSAFALSLAVSSDAAADRGEDRQNDRYQSQQNNYEYDRRRDNDRSNDRSYDRRRGDDRRNGYHDGGRRHGHGDRWRAHNHGNGYAYGRGKQCHRVVTKGYWGGRPAKIGGVQCYDRHGRGYIADSSRYLIKYLFINYSYR